MRKVLIMVFTLIILSSCSQQPSVPNEEGRTEDEPRFTKSDMRLDITEDRETGCKYLIYDWDRRAGVTPLLNSEGTPDCG